MYFYDRPDHVWGRIVEGLQTFGIERTMNVDPLLMFVWDVPYKFGK